MIICKSKLWFTQASRWDPLSLTRLIYSLAYKVQNTSYITYTSQYKLSQKFRTKILNNESKSIIQEERSSLSTLCYLKSILWLKYRWKQNSGHTIMQIPTLEFENKNMYVPDKLWKQTIKGLQIKIKLTFIIFKWLSYDLCTICCEMKIHIIIKL